MECGQAVKCDQTVEWSEAVECGQAVEWIVIRLVEWSEAAEWSVVRLWSRAGCVQTVGGVWSGSGVECDQTVE